MLKMESTKNIDTLKSISNKSLSLLCDLNLCYCLSRLFWNILRAGVPCASLVTEGRNSDEYFYGLLFIYFLLVSGYGLWFLDLYLLL